MSQKSAEEDITALFYPEHERDAHSGALRDRRQGFLATLDDKTYEELHSYMLFTSDLRFPDVHSLIRTTRQEGKVMSTIIGHVGHWLNKNPTIIQERNASKPLLRMEFLPALEKKYGKDANQKSIELERQLLVHVQEHMDGLTDKTVECFLNQFPTNTEQDYIRRFDHSSWKNILVIVHAMVGPHFQNEAVARFNTEDPNMIHSKPINTIIYGICDFIARNTEVSQSPVLSKKSAMETLYTKLQSIIAEWAVDECDKALNLGQNILQPVELARVKAERIKYAAVAGLETEEINGVTSQRNHHAMTPHRPERGENERTPHNTVTLGGWTVIQQLTQEREEDITQRELSEEAASPLDSDISDTPDRVEIHNFDEGKQQNKVLEGAKSSARRGVVPKHTEKAHGYCHIVREGETRPTDVSQATQSRQKGWRRRPVAQVSL
jgi:hypothetical protein